MLATTFAPPPIFLAASPTHPPRKFRRRLERSNRNRATRTAIATEIMVELMKFCIGRGSKRNLRFLLGST